MVELNVYKNTNTTSAQYGKAYARVDYKEQFDVSKLAKHMSEHNTPFSEGTIRGILTDMVKCIRELTLNGNTVKIDDLAIFKCSVEANGMSLQEGYQVRAGLGTMPKTVTAETVQPAIKSAKLLAQATGEFTKKELNDDATFRWTRDAQKTIDAKLNPAPDPGD